MTKSRMQSICCDVGLTRKKRQLNGRLCLWWSAHEPYRTQGVKADAAFEQLAQLIADAYDNGSRDVRLDG